MEGHVLGQLIEVSGLCFRELGNKQGTSTFTEGAHLLISLSPCLLGHMTREMIEVT